MEALTRRRRVFSCVRGAASGCVCLLVVAAWPAGSSPVPPAWWWRSVALLCACEVAKHCTVSCLSAREQGPLPHTRTAPGSRASARASPWRHLGEEGKTLLRMGLQWLLWTWVFFCVALLFGAPVFSEHEESMVFGAMLGTLTVLPACSVLGTDALPMLFFGLRPKDEVGQSVQRVVCGTLLGAWMGAALIPLDWDRPWQKWPTPCCMGALLGHALGSMVSALSHLLQLVSIPAPRHNHKAPRRKQL